MSARQTRDGADRDVTELGFLVPSFTARYFLSLGNIVSSFLFGALAMILWWIYFPDSFVVITRAAAGVREWVVNRGWPARYEGALRILVHDQTLIFMFFTISARIIVGGLIMLVSKLYWGRAHPDT